MAQMGRLVCRIGENRPGAEQSRAPPGAGRAGGSPGSPGGREAETAAGHGLQEPQAGPQPRPHTPSLRNPDPGFRGHEGGSKSSF